MVHLQKFINPAYSSIRASLPGMLGNRGLPTLPQENQTLDKTSPHYQTLQTVTEDKYTSTPIPDY